MDTPIEELFAFLQRLKLENYRAEALAWCDATGAAFLDEVWEQREQVADALKLKSLERERLTGKRGAAALKEIKAKNESCDPEAGPARKRVKVEKVEKEETIKILLNDINIPLAERFQSIQIRSDEKVEKIAQMIETQTGRKLRLLELEKSNGSAKKTIFLAIYVTDMRLSDYTDYNIRSGMVINFAYSEITIFARSINNKMIRINGFMPHWMVFHLKMFIYNKLAVMRVSVPYGQLRLEFRGRQLGERERISEAGIKDQSTLICSKRS